MPRGHLTTWGDHHLSTHVHAGKLQRAAAAVSFICAMSYRRHCMSIYEGHIYIYGKYRTRWDSNSRPSYRTETERLKIDLACCHTILY